MIGKAINVPVVAFSVRLYEILLNAYPTKFQQEYGSQMVQVFQDCCLRTLSRSGTNGMVKLWTVTLLDLIQSVLSEHAQKEVQVKTEMKPEDIQLAGSALIWAAVAFVVGNLLLFVRSAFWGISVILITFLSMPLLIVGLLAVRNRYGEKIGAFGKNVLLAGIILGPLMTFIGFFGVGDPGQLHGLRFVVALLFIIGPSVLFACLALFGLVALYKKPLPRWNVVPVLAGAWYPILMLIYVIVSMRTGDWGSDASISIMRIASSILCTIQGAALAALGYILKSDAAEETAALG
jgi:hypothetical protein